MCVRCHIQKKFGDIGFSWGSWEPSRAELWWGSVRDKASLAQRIEEHNNYYSRLKCLLINLNVEILKKILSWSILGTPFWVPIAVDYLFGSRCDVGFRIYIFDFITTTSFRSTVFQMLIMANTFLQNDALI